MQNNARLADYGSLGAAQRYFDYGVVDLFDLRLRSGHHHRTRRDFWRLHLIAQWRFVEDAHSHCDWDLTNLFELHINSRGIRTEDANARVAALDGQRHLVYARV